MHHVYVFYDQVVVVIQHIPNMSRMFNVQWK